MSDYEQKYLKYKKKYLKMKGGRIDLSEWTKINNKGLQNCGIFTSDKYKNYIFIRWNMTKKVIQMLKK